MRNLLILCLFGCAAQNVEGPTPHEISEPEPARQPEPARDPDPSPRPTGVIQRKELLSVLDQSPGAFLQHVDVSPRFTGGRFVGWRIVALFPGDDRFAGVDIHAGDVVLRVNGRPIEKPEQLMDVWQLLRTAPTLEIELERNGEPRTLRWPIQ